LKKPIAILATLLFCAMAAQNATAQTQLGPHAIGMQLGIVSPENSDAAVGFGVFADMGTLTPSIRLLSHLDYWSKSVDSPFGGSATVGDVALTARGEYMFPVRTPRVQPFAGAGLGMHFLHAKVETPGFPDITDSSTKLGLDMGGGFAMPVNPRTDFRTEMWYGIVDGLNQLSIKAGLAFKLGS